MAVQKADHRIFSKDTFLHFIDVIIMNSTKLFASSNQYVL